MEEISLYSVDPGSEVLQSPYRGGVHNCQYVKSESQLADVPASLYAAVTKKEITYDVPIDAPLYASLVLYAPDSTDVKEGE